MIDKMADWYELRQFKHTSEMVTVKVRNEQIIDGADTGVMSGRQDSVCVAGFCWIAGSVLAVPSPSGIDE